MDNPSIANAPPLLQSPLSSCSGRRRSSGTLSAATSPEFEFWMVRNPSLAPTHLLSADELFVDGRMLPLQRLSLDPPDVEDPPSSRPNSVDDARPSAIPDSDPRSGPEITAEPASSSKRWMDTFKKSGDKKSVAGVVDSGGTRAEEKVRGKDKGKKDRDKERRGRNGSGAPELNINIWPFTRSSSAGTSRTRPGIPSRSTRKASSAPCSRSNSAGDSKSRVKLPSSPGRVGVHVGRSSPVWQARRGSGGGAEPVARSNAPKSVKKKECRAETEAKRLNVPTCIGYRNGLGCRNEETTSGGARAGNGVSDGRAVGNAAVGGGYLFNIRNLFMKKVH